ncbi:MAG: hypothetical protein QOG41_117, partial [Thermoleophilaceae bacterium]|nr:hypothetical protein [Thermoleophilaceae bacterium]
GSPSIDKVSEAQDQADAKVRASVRGKGDKRTLVYDILRRKAQRVTFLDTGRGGAARPIGTVAGGGHGKLHFAAVPGAGRRTVVAEFELAGLEAERVTVAHFDSPPAKLPKPKHVKARHKGSKVSVSWRGVARAKSYEVVVRLATGGARTLRTKSHHARVGRVPKWAGGTVSVRAVSPVRRGAAARAHFRGRGHRKTRVKPLPRGSR